MPVLVRVKITPRDWPERNGGRPALVKRSAPMLRSSEPAVMLMLPLVESFEALVSAAEGGFTAMVTFIVPFTLGTMKVNGTVTVLPTGMDGMLPVPMTPLVPLSTRLPVEGTEARVPFTAEFYFYKRRGAA